MQYFKYKVPRHIEVLLFNSGFKVRNKITIHCFYIYLLMGYVVLRLENVQYMVFDYFVCH